MRAELPALHPFSGRDVPWLLEERAALSGEKIFVHFCPGEGAAESLTYAAFAQKVQHMAAGLAGRGVAEGDYVILHMGNRLEFLIAWFACSWAGAIVVTTNALSAPGEMRYFADHIGARFAITETELLGVLKESGAAFDWVACVGEGGDLDFDALYAPEPMPRRPQDPARYNNIMFTSGTTSRPKAVVYTHANILWAAQRNAVHCGLRSDDVALTFLPLFHANALGYSMLATLWSGGTLVVQPKFSASRFWEVALAYQCTWTSVGPFVAPAIGPAPAPHHFRFWGNIWGDDPAPREMFGIPSLGWYGMTETVSHPILSDFGLASPPRAVGRAVAEYGVRLVSEDGIDIAPGQNGRLLVRGVRGLSMFWEYLNDPDATARAFDPGGWFDTGDMLTLLDDGSMVFADREKDMLKVGGENVAASEVERVIAGIPGVLETAVIGLRHEFLSEVPVAYVVAESPSETLGQTITDVCQRELAKFKLPREIIFIDALPRTSIGKLDKKALREELNNGR